MASLLSDGLHSVHEKLKRALERFGERISPMICKVCGRELRRTRRRNWERWLGIKLAAKCTACNRRVRFFSLSALRRFATARKV